MFGTVQVAPSAFARLSRVVQQSRTISTTAVNAAAAGSPSHPVKVVGVSGSLRKASRNTGLLRAIANKPPPGVDFEIADISQLPLYNDDLWQGGDVNNDDSALPASVKDFRAKIKSADVVIFSTPEYNFSVTGPLKNAIDWASKGPGLWGRKMVSAVGAAGGSLSARSALALQTTITSCGAVYPPPSGFVFVSAFGPQFDKDGNVIDPKLEESLINHVAKVAEWAVKYKSIE